MPWLISDALMKAYENSRSSQAQAAESLVDTCSDGEPSAQSNGNLTQQAYLQHDRMTAFSRLSRFGMTFRPLTADRGEDLLMWYREDFLARIFQSQGEARVLMERDQDSGEKWRGWLARFDPASSTLKTVQCSLFGGGARVIADLTALGYDAQWDVMGAADVGAPHQRDRIWILAYANRAQCKRNECPERSAQERAYIGESGWWKAEPNVDRVANGIPDRVDRLKAIGNGQVPIVAATAWRILTEGKV